MPALPASFGRPPVTRISGVRRFYRLGGVLAACALAPVAGAQQANSGPGRSPFLPQGWEQHGQAAAARPAGTVAEGGYVFNGMIQIGERTLFSIGNAETGQALLLEIGEKSGDVQVLSYDAQHNSVSLSGGGRTEELTLRKSDGEPLAVATATQGGSRGGARATTGGSQGDSNTRGRSRSGPSIAWMEARRDRMNELIERRRAAVTTEGDGAVTVGVGNAASTGTAGNTRASGSSARSGGTQAEGDRGSQPRSRRLRMQMNP